MGLITCISLNAYKGGNVLFLPPRVHELEEQVKDAETKADQVLEEEAKRHREAYSKIERDRNLEIDLLCNRYGLHQKDSVCLFIPMSVVFCGMVR